MITEQKYDEILHQMKIFEKHHTLNGGQPQFSFEKTKDCWERPCYKHSHVQSRFEGWVVGFKSSCDYFVAHFLIGLEDGTIEESEDGDIPLDSNDSRMGWFITPEKRKELERMLDG